jgi:pSer/pThr/pTyr-binding forkhead associated (FHA) protein
MDAELVFEWGPVRVQGRLAIGRDRTFSSIADRLGPFATVSREHAIINLTPDALRIVHVGSTNPTYLNGRPLKTGETAVLDDGDILRFSTRLRAVVRCRERSCRDPVSGSD